MTPVVLVIDDSLTVRMDLAEALRSSGLQVELCATAAAARASFHRKAVGLVILDLLLPDAEGLDLLREIKAERSGTPVMLLSTEADVKDRVRGLTTGADEYVGKPYDRSYVVARARKLLGAIGEHDRDARRPVLLIDDSLTFRSELGGALELAGYRVVMAVTGEEGLAEAARVRPEAIVVDGVLPGIDGASVIRRIRLDTALRRTPCLLLTAADERDAEVRALDAGADAFVRKGEDMSVLLARLAAILRGSAPAEDEGRAESALGPKRILAVDDSPTFLHELAEALRSEGYDVVLARSGEEALQLLAVQQVDCILLDLLMPGLGGKETCRRVKAAPGLRDVPLIMLTAVEDRITMIEGLSAGSDDYISKSSDFEILRARVRAQIRRKQFEDENRQIRERLLRMEIEAVEAKAAREVAEARSAQLAEVKRRNQELEAFSYSVSHDLRAPLRSIEGFGQALLDDYGDKIDDRGRGYLQHMRSAASRMEDLTHDLLELARVGRAELRRESVDVAQLAELVAEHLQKGHGGREVEIRIEGGLSATCDPGLIRIVLENLLGNAWKFSAHSSPAVIEVGRTQPDHAFFVRDNGVGFDMSEAPAIFAPFHRLHPESAFPGTGIGLATVQRIIDRHGGRIWAESAPDRGATFFFTLPPAEVTK